MWVFVEEIAIIKVVISKILSCFALCGYDLFIRSPFILYINTQNRTGSLKTQALHNVNTKSDNSVTKSRPRAAKIYRSK